MNVNRMKIYVFLFSWVSILLFVFVAVNGEAAQTLWKDASLYATMVMTPEE